MSYCNICYLNNNEYKYSFYISINYDLTGKPKRLLDPSAGLSAPTPPMSQSPYMYNQQVNFIE